MATTFTWKIAQLERETSDGYVYTAHWTVDAADGTYKSGAYGSQSLPRAYDVEPVEAQDAVLDEDGNVVTPAVAAVVGVPSALVPYADLTETQVVGWVKDKLGADRVTQIETALDNQITEQKTPTKATGKPWSD